jgi:hypothetical protein
MAVLDPCYVMLPRPASRVRKKLLDVVPAPAAVGFVVAVVMGRI